MNAQDLKKLFEKADSLFKTDYSLIKYDILSILISLDIGNLTSFIKDNKGILTKSDIHPYEIVEVLASERQMDVITKLEDMELTLNEKREILAILKSQTKLNIDTANFSKEYKTAINIEVNEDGEIVLDLQRNLEDYRGLDNLLRIDPEVFTEKQRIKFMKLCDICPNMKVLTQLRGRYFSTTSEYKEAEEWINSVLNNINPNYSKVQKMAIIDNAIGKKISYSHDFGTEVCNQEDCRALWKIIVSGYGVCNGIAKVEQYMFKRIGIESELVQSGTHAFLKVKDIELLLANGEIEKGNTIVDVTWNLASHRFGGKPDNFCINYEQARKNDVDSKGKDWECHKNDEQLQDATLSLDDQSLRALFTSVGLADKDGKFPINDLKEKSKMIDAFYANQPEHNINTQFLLLKQTCPEFATCQNESMSALSSVFLNNENLKFNKCVVNRVYNREDEEKKPVLFVYIDSDELGKKFYFVDKEEGQFKGLSQEEFTKQFECYEKDLENDKGIRPWENKEQERGTIDLSKSSGQIVAEKGNER